MGKTRKHVVQERNQKITIIYSQLFTESNQNYLLVNNFFNLIDIQYKYINFIGNRIKNKRNYIYEYEFMQPFKYRRKKSAQ